MSERNKAKRVSRREFLKTGTLVAGAAALAPALTPCAWAATPCGPQLYRPSLLLTAHRSCLLSFSVLNPS